MSKFDKYLEEEEFFFQEKKFYRKQKKLKKAKDRSKYKKTNIQKAKYLKNKYKNYDLKKAKVLSIQGSEIIVSCNKIKYNCTLRGNLKKEITKNKNIIAVGDLVDITIKNNHTAVIEKVNERFSILSRYDEKRRKRLFIAVNIDQVLITTSVVKPFFKPFLIDRYIIACEKENMTPIIIINKIDLLKKDKKEEKKYLNFLKIYKKLGYKILSVSYKKKKNLNSIRNIMKGKTSVFSGQSGTGKTSIINALLHTHLKTGDITKKTYKGAHITTKAQLLKLKTKGFCIDTPGIKGFNIWDLTIEDIKNYFFEIKKFSKKCKYSNCLHMNEPSCNVTDAAKKNKIPVLRFESYRSLIKELLEKKGKHYE